MQKTWKEMSENEKIAEALYQLRAGGEIRDQQTTEEFILTTYQNNYTTRLDYCNGDVVIIIEWQGRVIPVKVR